MLKCVADQHATEVATFQRFESAEVLGNAVLVLTFPRWRGEWLKGSRARPRKDDPPAVHRALCEDSGSRSQASSSARAGWQTGADLCRLAAQK